MKKLLLVLGLFAAVTQLFALSNFMRDTVFIVKGSIKDFSEMGINETITGSRVASSNPLDLQVGDIFVDVNGNAQKVTKIVKKGNNISIETETPEIAEVFKYISVPHQSTDFNDYGDDAVTYSPYMRSIIDDIKPEDEEDDKPLIDKVSIQDGPMLDAFMPEDSKKWQLTLNFSKDIKDYTKNVSDKLDELDDLAKAAKAAGDSKKANDMNNMASMLQKKNTTNNVSANLDITVGVQYKSTSNKLDYDYKYSLPGWNTHGSRWPWKWSWDSGGGYAYVQYENDLDIGLNFDLYAYIDEYFSAPIPGLAYGASSFGPYAGVYFDLEFYGGGGFNVSYYKHIKSFSSYRKDFTSYFTSRGEPRKTTDIWGPSAWQVYGQVGCELTVGPAVKFGFVALGMTLAQGKVSAGGYAEGEACLGYTWIDKDEEGAEKLGIDVDESPVLNVQNDDGEWEPKYEDGWTFFGDFAVGLFARITFEIWDGKWSAIPLDYKIPIFSDNGYNNSFAEGNWFEKMEGYDWYNQNF